LAGQVFNLKFSQRKLQIEDLTPKDLTPTASAFAEAGVLAHGEECQDVLRLIHPGAGA
jgi:hypothetical protein